MRVITAVVALLLALCTAPTAVGEETTPAPTPVPEETVPPASGRDGIVPVPTTAPEETVPVPEAPEGLNGEPFVDNSSLLDLRPMPIEFWTRSDRDDAITVFFTAGVPQCHGVHAAVYETPEAVTVDLLGGTPPEAVGMACIEIAVVGTLEVPLQAPLGDRAVLTTRLDKPH